MRQYCRYCSNICLLDDGLGYCKNKNKQLDEAAIKRVNRCDMFVFCDLDILTMKHRYRPRDEKPARGVEVEDGQIKLY